MRKSALVLLAAVSLAAIPANAARVEIVLDVSGSMREKMGGETRMDAARKAIRRTLAGLQRDSVVGLRLYGHRMSPKNKAESCQDTELAIPFQVLDKPGFLAVVNRAKPRGETPIAYSLEQAARDFGPASDEERVIILVSDGAESCGGDPAAAARNLLEKGFKVKIHTIGLDVDAAARAQLEAISTATGGEYHNAKNAEALAQSMTRLAQKSLLVTKGDDGLGQAVRGGDGHESAVEIQPGQLYRLDHHQRQGEYDYFYVPVTGSKFVSASIETPQAGVDIGKNSSIRTTVHPYAGLVLQDSARRKRGETDITGQRGEKKTLQGPLPGSHGGRLYVLVGSSHGDQHKDSRFSVSLADPPGDAGTSGDAGGTEQEALEIKPGAYKAHLDGDIDDEVDFFKFKADPNATYQVGVRPSAQVWLELSVAAANARRSATDSSDEPGRPARVEGLRFPKGGDVYVRVRYSVSRYSTDYSLDVTEEAGSAPTAEDAGNAPTAPDAGSAPTTQAAGSAPTTQAAGSAPKAQDAGSAPTAQDAGSAPTGQAERPAEGAAGPSIVQRFVSFLLWTVFPVVVALMVGAVGGYIKGRRRR